MKELRFYASEQEAIEDILKDLEIGSMDLDIAEESTTEGRYGNAKTANFVWYVAQDKKLSYGDAREFVEDLACEAIRLVTDKKGGSLWFSPARPGHCEEDALCTTVVIDGTKYYLKVFPQKSGYAGIYPVVDIHVAER